MPCADLYKQRLNAMSLRLVATSDTHAPVDPSTIPDGDVFVHAGDLMTTGYLDEWRWACDWLSKLPHKVKILVPGNHDFHLQVYPGPALQDLRRAGVTVVGLPGNVNYMSKVLPNGMRLLGLPYVTNLPRWAFNAEESFLEEELRRLEAMHKYDIVVSHAPINGVLDLSMRDNLPAGIVAYRDFCQRAKPRVWIHGHIHEGFGQAKFSDTDVYNVAMSDRKHRHANGAVVIDL